MRLTKQRKMKRFGNLFDQVTNYDNLYHAHERARRGKSHYIEVRKINSNPELHLMKLQELMRNGKYKTSDYEIQTRKEGRKMRVICKLPYYPDRIVHHAIMNVVERIWIKSLIRDTYQSLPGRGVHLASERIKKVLRDDTSGTQYCLKLDVRKFYPSVDNEVMKGIVRKKIKDVRLLALLDEIIDSTKGLPIGNYLSQIFGNLYLSEFDHWIKEVKKVKHYFRYCDDLVLFGKSKEGLHELKKEISDYLNQNLKLEVKGDWQVFPVDDRGVDVVGFRFFRTHTLLRRTIADGYRKKVRKIKKDWQGMTTSQIINGLMSYTGWMKYADCHGLRETYIDEQIKLIARITCQKAGMKNPLA